MILDPALLRYYAIRIPKLLMEALEVRGITVYSSELLEEFKVNEKFKVVKDLYDEWYINTLNKWN